MKCELCRITLTETVDYDPYALFCHIDRFSNGYITTEDIIAFLKTRHQEYNYKHIYEFAKLYDADNDGRLTYTNFLSMTTS